MLVIVPGDVITVQVSAIADAMIVYSSAGGPNQSITNLPANQAVPILEGPETGFMVITGALIRNSADEANTVTVTLTNQTTTITLIESVLEVGQTLMYALPYGFKVS